MTTASQNAAILARLQRGDTITPLDALNDPDIRCQRLAARIWEIKKTVPEIEKVPIRTPGGATVAGYRLPVRMDGAQRIFA